MLGGQANSHRAESAASCFPAPGSEEGPRLSAHALNLSTSAMSNTSKAPYQMPLQASIMPCSHGLAALYSIRITPVNPPIIPARQPTTPPPMVHPPEGKTRPRVRRTPYSILFKVLRMRHELTS